VLLTPSASSPKVFGQLLWADMLKKDRPVLRGALNIELGVDRGVGYVVSVGSLTPSNLNFSCALG
jgi:hypothetical protein